MSEPAPSNSETVIEPFAPKYAHAVLEYFQTHSSAVATVEELARDISDQQNEDQRQVAIRLHHVTLPKLAETGLIEYEAESNVAGYRGNEKGGRLTEETER